MSAVEQSVRWSLRRPAFVLVSVAALAVTGIIAFRDLGVEAFPDLTNNQVVVITEATGLAAPEVEQRITYPLETALMGVPDATEVRSISKFGLSLITIVFDDDVPVYFARQLVTERVNEVRDRLPEGVTPTLGPVATAFGEIYQYLVEGPDEDALDAPRVPRLGDAHQAARHPRRGRGQLVGRPVTRVRGRGRSRPGSSPTTSRCRTWSRRSTRTTTRSAAASSKRVASDSPCVGWAC